MNYIKRYLFSRIAYRIIISVGAIGWASWSNYSNAQVPLDVPFHTVRHNQTYLNSDGVSANVNLTYKATDTNSVDHFVDRTTVMPASEWIGLLAQTDYPVINKKVEDAGFESDGSGGFQYPGIPSDFDSMPSGTTYKCGAVRSSYSACFNALINNAYGDPTYTVFAAPNIFRTLRVGNTNGISIFNIVVQVPAGYTNEDFDFANFSDGSTPVGANPSDLTSCLLPGTDQMIQDCSSKESGTNITLTGGERGQVIADEITGQPTITPAVGDTITNITNEYNNTTIQGDTSTISNTNTYGGVNINTQGNSGSGTGSGSGEGAGQCDPESFGYAACIASSENQQDYQDELDDDLSGLLDAIAGVGTDPDLTFTADTSVLEGLITGFVPSAGACGTSSFPLITKNGVTAEVVVNSCDAAPVRLLLEWYLAATTIITLFLIATKSKETS